MLDESEIKLWPVRYLSSITTAINNQEEKKHPQLKRKFSHNAKIV